MAKTVSNKIKLSIIMLIGGTVFLYNKIFGGKAQPIPEGDFVVGQPQEQTKPIQEENIEIVAVAYAETPEKGVREVVKRTGNLDFIKPGQKVLIKPNVNTDDPAPGTTHAAALGEIVRLAKNKQAYVIVGDRSNPRWNTLKAMEKTGMFKAAKDAGADEIVAFEDGEWIRVTPENAKSWPKGFRVPSLLQEVDHIISVPVLHTHSITSHSLALKNLVGLIHPADRMIFHASPKRDEMITEISLAINPSLTIIDGTKSFIDGGPSAGTLSNPKVYLASQDILMAEVFGIELLKKDKAKLFWDSPWDSGQVKHAVELNISQFDKEKIQEELTKSNLFN